MRRKELVVTRPMTIEQVQALERQLDISYPCKISVAYSEENIKRGITIEWKIGSWAHVNRSWIFERDCPALRNLIESPILKNLIKSPNYFKNESEAKAMIVVEEFETKEEYLAHVRLTISEKEASNEKIVQCFERAQKLGTLISK